MLSTLRTPLLVALAAGLLVIFLSLALTTCHTQPPGELSRTQQRATEARVTAAGLAARADSARATHGLAAAARLDRLARAYQDSATNPSAYEKTSVVPAPDSARVQRFLSDLFAR